ncbi:prolyl 4-hydroxylase alpha subunit [Cryptosporidium xiaoi]|uniref:Prolyl 4-hydroxylase alpha subunit n=1 Tax=Cryptosporidium xiaoi TaxID=659607 RepID=A0AAV9XWS6_9CRYT
MSENSSNINDKTKNVIKGVTPPEPKVVNTYINMVPISDTNLTQQPLDNMQQSTSNQTAYSNGSVPTSQFPLSAMNLEQIQQFMSKMRLNDTKGQNNGLGVNGLGTQVPGINETNTIDTMMKNSASVLVPPVGALDPNILASLGLNVQKPTLQPIQFPNMQAGVPNLCGIQGQDLNLAAWMQKQKIALALSQMQQNQNKQISSDLTKGEGGLTVGLNNTEGQHDRLSDPQNNSIPGTTAPSATQSQLTPQLAAFLGNPNLIPTTGVTAGLQVPGTAQGFGQIPGGIGTTPGVLGGIPGFGGGIGVAGEDANAKLLQSVTSNLMQQSITGNMANVDAMIKQYQENYVNNQLSAAAQLLRQHGIQATIDSSYNGGDLLSKSKKPSILQRIVASKVNPEIFVVPNALTFEECDNIIELIRDRLEASKVSISRNSEKPNSSSEGNDNNCNTNEGYKKEEDMDDEFCKSTTACINPEETNLIKEIEGRLGLLVDSNTQHMEPILVHKYSVNDYIKEHHDGDTRTHTIAVFLSDVENGGELDFPYAGIRIKPKKGFAVVWPNIDSQGKLDYTTVHAVNKIQRPDEDKTEQKPDSDISSYLLYLHINKEPVRLQYEASLAMKQVIQIKNSDNSNDIHDPKTISQVSYTINNKQQNEVTI